MDNITKKSSDNENKKSTDDENKKQVDVEYESSILDYFPVKAGDRVAVLGACTGGDVMHYAELVDIKGFVLGVEPVSKNFEILKRRVSQTWQITILKAAVWGWAGRGVINIGTNPTNHSLVKDWKIRRELVDMVTWDYIVEKFGRFDLCVMDIEGAEVDVVKSMKKNLPKCLIVEYHEKFGVNPEELIRMLEERGYNVFREMHIGMYLYCNLK